jgi:hypothetical protein
MRWSSAAKLPSLIRRCRVGAIIKAYRRGSLSGCDGGVVRAGPFDELTVFEAGAGADQGDEMWPVYRPPAGLSGLDEFERHREAGGLDPGPLVTFVRAGP